MGCCCALSEHQIAGIFVEGDKKTLYSGFSVGKAFPAILMLDELNRRMR